MFLVGCLIPVEFWNASKHFFNATVSLSFLAIAFQTIPYAPLYENSGETDAI
jgi:hypothetical protein